MMIHRAKLRRLENAKENTQIVEEHTEPIAPIVDESKEEVVLKRTDIMRMSKGDLVALAISKGVKEATGMKGAELKALLIDMLCK